MRLASSYSLQQGSRGLPMILEYQVIPGENDAGVRLVVNEHWYTGPRGAGLFCIGWAAIQSRVRRCRASCPFRSVPPPSFWPTNWPIAASAFASCGIRRCRRAGWCYGPKTVLPNAIRIEMAPLAPDAGRLQPVTLTIPVHVTRPPMESYLEQQ